MRSEKVGAQRRKDLNVTNLCNILNGSVKHNIDIAMDTESSDDDDACDGTRDMNEDDQAHNHNRREPVHQPQPQPHQPHIHAPALPKIPSIDAPQGASLDAISVLSGIPPVLSIDVSPVPSIDAPAGASNNEPNP